MRCSILITTVLLLLLLPILTSAHVESIDPQEPAGEGGETSLYAVRLDHWPLVALGYTCDNIDDHNNYQCPSLPGDSEDVFYKFMSPLGTGVLEVHICTQNTYRPTVFVYDPDGNSLDCATLMNGIPGCGDEAAVIMDVPIDHYGDLYRIAVDGHTSNGYTDGCGDYTMFGYYTPKQLGNNGNAGVGGVGGYGGAGGGGGIPCEFQAGIDGSPGGPGSQGGSGGAGGNALLRIYGDAPIHNYSNLTLGGLPGPNGASGNGGSTGGIGGHGGAPYANGTTGGEPDPDYQPGDVNGGAAGLWPSGTGGNGNNSGGGGGGGGSSVGISGGYGAGGGVGAIGAQGSGGNGATGEEFWRPTIQGMALNDPFQIGGDGGRGGQGGQGGHGGGGGGGAGECWFNPEGAGGMGGPGGSGGSGGPGGPGGNGSIHLADGGELVNRGILTIGRGDEGGEGVIDFAASTRIINDAGAQIIINHNGAINMDYASTAIANDGSIINAYQPLVNHGLYSGTGTVSGTLVNLERCSPGLGEGMATVSGYEESGHFETSIHGQGNDPLQYSALRVESSLTIEAGSVMVAKLISPMDESQLEIGDTFDIIRYPAGVRAGQYSVVESQPPLTDGAWELEYDHDLGSGQSSVRLVYTQGVSPVDGSELPARFALSGVHPNPFNPRATISYELPTTSAVVFKIYNVAGRLVWESASGNVQSAGRHELVWNGVDRDGRSMPSGTYLLNMEAGDFLATRRMALVR